jgi:hypothetical protein
VTGLGAFPEYLTSPLIVPAWTREARIRSENVAKIILNILKFKRFRDFSGIIYQTRSKFKRDLNC